MAVTPGVPRATKLAWMQAATPTADTYKLVLYTNTSTLAPLTATTYNATGEVSGTGYTAGGITLSGATVANSTAGAYLTFSSPVTLVNATFTGATGAAIVNTSKSNRIEALFALAGGPYSPSAQNVTITLPAPGDAALVRLD